MDIKIQAFVNAIKAGKLKLEDVPEIYRAEVETALAEN